MKNIALFRIPETAILQAKQRQRHTRAQKNALAPFGNIDTLSRIGWTAIAKQQANESNMSSPAAAANAGPGAGKKAVRRSSSLLHLNRLTHRLAQPCSLTGLLRSLCLVCSSCCFESTLRITGPRQGEYFLDLPGSYRCVCYRAIDQGDGYVHWIPPNGCVRGGQLRFHEGFSRLWACARVACTTPVRG